MSADNWTTCPKCNEKHIQSLHDARRQLDKLYGKVSLSQYQAEEARVRNLENAKSENTLREDYSQGTNDVGEYNVSYSCSCSICKFHWSYENTIVIHTIVIH